jgi:putative endonuclease
MRQFYVYLLASHSRRLYTGVTNNLLRRVAEHREGMCDFTSKYQITRLVYFETTANVMSAIEREKELKGWVRKKKVELIERVNPAWRDLAADLFR